jgi:hypothetical protein
MIDILIQKAGVAQVRKYIVSLLAPLQTQTDAMKIFEVGELKRAIWNGQKIVLQAALNDIFGITSPPYILVENNQDLGVNLYFYEPSESQPVYFSEPSEVDPVYFFEPSELSPIDYDFKILIPTGIWTTELERQIKAQAKLYKLAGPKMIVEQY